MSKKSEAERLAAEYLVQYQQKLEQKDLDRYKVAENHYSQLRDVIARTGIPDILSSLSSNIPVVGCVYIPGEAYLILGKNSLVQLPEKPEFQSKLTHDIAEFLKDKKN